MADFLPNVEYKIVEDFPDYKVGTDGSVWSKRLSRGKEWQQMKTGLTDTGYRVAGLRNNHTRYLWAVHILVLRAFVGPRPKGLFGLHKDDNKENNNLPNLYWGTRKENVADRIRNGHVKPWLSDNYFRTTQA